jgi:hypothetical protein
MAHISLNPLTGRGIEPSAPRWPVAAGGALALGAGLLIGHGSVALAAAVVGGLVFTLTTLEWPERTALLVVAALPWFFYPTTSGRFSVSLAIPAAGLVAVVLLLKQRQAFAALRRRLPRGTYVVLFAIAAVMAVLSRDVTTAASRLLYLALFGAFAAGLATAIVAGRMEPARLVRAIVLGAAIAGLAVTIQVIYGLSAGRGSVTDWLNSVYPLFGGTRAAGYTTRNWYVSDAGMVRGIFPFMAAPSAGQYLMLSFVAAVWLRRERRTAAPATRALDTAALLAIGVGLVATLSRQSWVGAVAGLLALSVWRRGLPTVAGVAGALAVVSLLPMPGRSETFGDYLATAGDTSTTSSGTRLGLWQQAIDLIPSHALRGVGPGLIGTLNPDPSKEIYYAHNVFLDSTVELGVAGGVALVALLVLGLRLAYRRAATLSFALLIAFAVAGMFDDVLYFPRNGLLVATAFALLAASERRPAPA